MLWYFLAHWRVKIEAVYSELVGLKTTWEEELTFQELLASVFLEERFVGHGTVEVVDHQAEDRVDFLLGVSGVVGNGGIPGPTLQDEACQVHGSSGNLALGIAHEAMIKQADLHEILAQGSGLDIVVVGLGDAAQEVHRVGVAHVVLEGGQNVTLSIENLLV